MHFVCEFSYFYPLKWLRDAKSINRKLQLNNLRFTGSYSITQYCSFLVFLFWSGSETRFVHFWKIWHFYPPENIRNMTNQEPEVGIKQSKMLYMVILYLEILFIITFSVFEEVQKQENVNYCEFSHFYPLKMYEIWQIKDRKWVLNYLRCFI